METVTYLEIPDKSENDPKHYKIVVLANDLKALLVSEPNALSDGGLSASSSYASSTNNEASNAKEVSEQLAACALLVDVGSFSAPINYQGIAHFLEHMIFMGSEKFPVENAFDVHIKKSGGFVNARTDCEKTLFYFEVSEEHLDSSMDYFVALLKAPLMKKEAMTRERNSVESEFQQTRHDDAARRDRLLASLANKSYPHGTFIWGNLKSLKEDVPSDDELHRELHEFRERHYSGHRMIVAVQARLPIDELESLIVKHFSGIPSNNVSPQDFSKLSHKDAFSAEFHNQVFFVKPVKSVCNIELTWVLPPMTKLYKCKPDNFLAHLIGHEGEGSLGSYLRRRLWGLELLAGPDGNSFGNNSMYTLFKLRIYLTENGFKHVDKVLEATFAFIKLFADCIDAKHLRNIVHTEFTELQHGAAANFRFEIQQPAYYNVQSLAVYTKNYPPKHILTGPHLYFEYDEEEIRDVIKYLNEFKFNIMITSQQKTEGIEYDKKEKWFGTEYTNIPMPQAWRDLWENSKPIPELYLPRPNRFIASDFRLFWHENGKPKIPVAPKKILQTDICELWFRQDDTFNLPDAYMYFYFKSPLLKQSPKNDTMNALFVQCVNFHLVEELYAAIMAGLSYDLFSDEKGIRLQVSGYNNKQHLLVDIVIKAIVSMREYMSEEYLDVFKNDQKKSCFNSLIKPSVLNSDIRRTIMEHTYWSILDNYNCFDEIALDDMLDYADKFTKELYVQALMQGNLTEETALNIMDSVLSTLNCQNIKENKYMENRTVQLPLGSHWIRCHGLNDKDVNTVVANMYQIGPSSIRIRSILDLLVKILEEPIFHMLRTREQLGYFVSTSVSGYNGIAGYLIRVNSQESKFSASHVEERIEAFRSKIFGILDNMPDAEFNHVRESLIKIKQITDMSLSDEVSRNWSEIINEVYFFNRRQKEIDLLRTLTKQDIIDFYISVSNDDKNLRKLSVQVIGKATVSVPVSTPENVDGNLMLLTNNKLPNKLNLTFIPREDDNTTIVNVEDFKKNLYVYPGRNTTFEDNAVKAVNQEERQSNV